MCATRGDHLPAASVAVEGRPCATTKRTFAFPNLHSQAEPFLFSASLHESHRCLHCKSCRAGCRSAPAY